MSNCLAVGANFPQMATQVIAERWNGTRWTRAAMPKPAGADEVTIDAVACPSRTECVAVGTGYPPGDLQDRALPLRRLLERHPLDNRPGRASARTADFRPAWRAHAAKSCYAVGNYTPKGGASPHR